MTNYATEPLSTLNADLNTAVAGVNSLSGYATKEELTAYATETYVQDYVDEHSGGDYLPLSGGNLSGRIYLKKTETIVIPGESYCTIIFDQSQSFWNDFAEDNFNFTAHYEITVLNAGQEFVNMLANYDGYTGESLGQWNVNVYVRLEDTNGMLLNPVEVETSGTVSFGNAYCNGSISINEYISELEEWEASGEIGNLVFDEGSGGNGPSVHLEFNYNGDQSDFADDWIGDGSDWTVHSTSETTTVTTTEPFALSSDVSCYVDAKIGSINTILDSINGQTV